MSPTSYHAAPPRTKEAKLYAQNLVNSTYFARHAHYYLIRLDYNMPMKRIRLGVLMDDISSIKPNKDSSFAMMLEAQDRGWEIQTFDSADMFYSDGKVFASTKITSVQDSERDWHKSSPSNVINLSSLDVVFKMLNF